MPDDAPRPDTVTITFRITTEEHKRFQEVVRQLKDRETLGKITTKSAFLKGLQLTEKWLEELRRTR